MEQGNEMTVTKDLFRRVGVDEQKSESVVRPSISYWQDAVRRLKQNKPGCAPVNSGDVRHRAIYLSPPV